MSEEAVEVVENTEVAEEVVETPAVPTVEDLAKADGWKPKEEYKGDPSKWRSAETYVDRKELIGKNTKLAGEIKELKATTKAILEHNAKIQDASYKKAKEELKAQYKEALLEGDEEQAELIDKQIEEVKEQFQEPQPTTSQAYESWHEKNQWYMNDKAMTVVADSIAKDMPDATEAEVFAKIDKDMRETFPHKFSNPKRERGAVVEPNRAGTDAKQGLTVKDLTDNEKRSMRAFVGNGTLSEKEYLEQLETVRG